MTQTKVWNCGCEYIGQGDCEMDRSKCVAHDLLQLVRGLTLPPDGNSLPRALKFLSEIDQRRKQAVTPLEQRAKDLISEYAETWDETTEQKDHLRELLLAFAEQVRRETVHDCQRICKEEHCIDDCQYAFEQLLAAPAESKEEK